ncbi:MAG: phosphoenolpyruvate carboxykinase domain-containing protein, partial [Gammaproteobacteria bacterium]
ERLFAVDVDAWLAEIPGIKQHYAQFGDKIPQTLMDEVDALEQRLKNA